MKKVSKSKNGCLLSVSCSWRSWKVIENYWRRSWRLRPREIGRNLWWTESELCLPNCRKDLLVTIQKRGRKSPPEKYLIRGTAKTDIQKVLDCPRSKIRTKWSGSIGGIWCREKMRSTRYTPPTEHSPMKKLSRTRLKTNFRNPKESGFLQTPPVVLMLEE